MPTYQRSYMTKQIWHWQIRMESGRRKVERKTEKGVCIGAASIENIPVMVKHLQFVWTHTRPHRNTHQTRQPAVLLLHPVLQIKTISLLFVFYCFCCLSLTSWKYPNCLYYSTSFAGCWLLKLARMRTVNKMRQYSHPMHSVYTTETTGLHCHPRANRNFIAIVQKETYLYKRKEGVEHFTFLLRKAQRIPYKS